MRHDWQVVKEAGRLTFSTEWRCPGCHTRVSTADWRKSADEAARESGIDPDCQVQMVQNLMTE